jgi:hypothetical protein
MKIIFLDIDGVLNSSLFLKDHKNTLIDDRCVSLLGELIIISKAKVVLHSGWKALFDDNMLPTRDDAAFLHNVLRKNKISLYDKTPDFSTEEIRKAQTFSKVKAKEILSWIETHASIESYVVLDDLDLNNDEVSAHQIKTDNQKGLTKKDVDNALKMLNQTL